MKNLLSVRHSVQVIGAALAGLFCAAVAGAQDLDFYGDILLSRGVEKVLASEGAWKGMAPLFASDSIAIAGLEGAVGDASSCERGRVPCFSMGPGLVAALAPFDVLGLAGRHALDLGEQGQQDTVYALRREDIVPLGGERFSTIMPAMEGTLGIIAVTDIVGANSDRRHLMMADAPEVLKEIRRLKELTGLVAVMVRWGKDGEALPAKRMRELAASYIRAGADIVVGRHPQAAGKAECVEGRPVVYSLGRLLSDQRSDDARPGAVLHCAVAEDDRLTCGLTGLGVMTNSFIPVPSNKWSYADENAVLAACRPLRERAWSGPFALDKIVRRLVVKKDPAKKPPFTMELQDPSSGALIIRSPNLPVERLQPVDVNGDGILEVMVIENIFSPIDYETARRVYLYSLDQTLRVLWKGGALSRPLVDAVFINTRGGEAPVLIALHSDDTFAARNPRTTGRIVTSYRWTGSAFAILKEVAARAWGDRLTVRKDKVLLIDGKGTVAEEFPAAGFH